MVSSTIASSQIAGSYGIAGTVNSVLSLGNPITAVLTGVNQVAGLFGLNSSDPKGDQERINRINLAFDLAMRGDDTPQISGNPNTNLEGASGRDYLEYIATNNHGNPRNPGPGTAAPNTNGAPVYGSQIAYRYAQGKFAEYRARQAAGTLGVGLIGVSDIPARVDQLISTSIVPILFAIVAVVVVVMVAKKVRK